MQHFVAILMGSDSDLPTMQCCIDTLKKFNIPYEARVSSAHRTPSQTQQYVIDAQARGCQVFIAGAGLAAHLAGAVAANTTRPVIGVPLSAGSLDGMDALLSTSQMPGGIPVATVAIGKPGAKNAAYLAMQILALSNPDIAEQLQADRQAMAKAIETKNQQLQEAV